MNTLLAGFPLIVPVDVAWADMDAYQHVNNVTYLRWFETGRIAYFERANVILEAGAPVAVGPILASLSCRYRAPVTYPDRVHVGIRVTSLGVDRFTMGFSIASEALQRVVATGDGSVVSYDYAAGAKAPVPEAWKEGIIRLQGALPEPDVLP